MAALDALIDWEAGRPAPLGEEGEEFSAAILQPAALYSVHLALEHLVE
jgi:hypothetical protein